MKWVPHTDSDRNVAEEPVVYPTPAPDPPPRWGKSHPGDEGNLRGLRGRDPEGNPMRFVEEPSPPPQPILPFYWK